MKMLPVAILAGGLATRLGKLTEHVPKSLIEVAGRPFIVHQLQLLAQLGAEHVVLCIGHLGEMVQRCVGDGRDFGLRVHYSLDGSAPLGTGGAVRQALPQLGERFFVLYGDSYLRNPMVPVQQEFQRSTAPALMCVLRNEGRWERSNVDFAEGRVRRYSKREPSPDMQYVDYGLSAFTAAAVSAMPLQFDLGDLFESAARDGQLAGYEIFERFYEVGSVQGITALESFLTSRKAS